LQLNESKYDQSSNDKSDIDEEILNIEKVKRNLDFDGSTEISNQKEKTFEENSASQEVIVDPERISEDSFTSRGRSDKFCLEGSPMVNEEHLNSIVQIMFLKDFNFRS